ncbi:DinB family protein [Mucilaginibacter pocheonensis]|uniref:Damage-inducible protein DinB n=1 Tax=Mucilaginibacter pocheonensis TaxID=398050 RepID=A0ABU1T858_9SPHI|nr:DinB family protein [Mucilaginibacter pocheonensis]MDR6941574.1 putative damage-inducible protein DinB [Mucilaginibacter pocheonensis]
MSISVELSYQLEKVLSGDPWYGSPVYDIVDGISFETAYEKPPGSIHNIAEIVLHMIAWTEEVMDRMNGLTAGMPTSGDWPETGSPDEQKWQNYVNDLKLVNVNLVGIIQNFPPEQWSELINDERNRDLGTGVTYEELINGLIQHHIYHSAQIALLNRIING